jgi:excisionase family DNA binding protein
MSKTLSSQDPKPIEALTVKEAAYILKVSPQTIYGWCKNKKITHFRVIGTIRIPLRTVNFLLKSSSSYDLSG